MVPWKLSWCSCLHEAASMSYGLHSVKKNSQRYLTWRSGYCLLLSVDPFFEVSFLTTLAVVQGKFLRG